MTLISGQHLAYIDPKGRCLIPGPLRNALPEGQQDKLHLAKSVDACIVAFSMQQWERHKRKFDKFKDDRISKRSMVREFISASFDAPFDSQGRILVPSLLLEHAHITSEIKQALVVGCNRYIEIWNPKIFEEKRAAEKELIYAVADKFFD